MSTINTILEAEREAKQIVATAEAEAAEVVRAAEEAKAREIESTKQRLIEEERAALAAYDAELDKEVSAMEKQSMTAVAQLEKTAQEKHTEAVQAVMTALRS